jgi:hypothetical protein
MRECSDLCKELNISCPEENSDCRFWIDFEDDLNCTLIAVDNNEGRPMTLRDIGLRLSLTHPRIDQIERQAVKRLSKKLKKEDLFP